MKRVTEPLYLKSFLAGLGGAIVIFLISLFTSKEIGANLFSLVTTILIFGSIIFSALFTTGSRYQNNREGRQKQLRFSIAFVVAAIPCFIGFIINFYLG